MFIPTIVRTDENGCTPTCLAEVKYIIIGNIRFVRGGNTQRRVGHAWVDLDHPAPPPPPPPA